MNHEIEFEHPEAPRSKERPRLGVYRKNGKLKKVAYTPKKTHSYEKRLGLFAEKLMNKQGIKQFAAKIPIECTIVAFYPIPESTSRHNRELMLSGKLLPTKRPDCDNVLKIILDALNKIVYYDDCQICECHVFKKYGLVPRISVKIKELKP